MIRLLIFVVALGLLASCRSAKNIQTAIGKKDTTAAVAASDTRADSLRFIKQVLQRLDSNHIDFTTFSAKIDVDYSDGRDKKFDVNANLRMYKDSAIWVSLSAVLGIEAMRALITKDSVFLLNKLEKTYTSRSVDYLQELTKLPLNLSTLQNLIVGNPVYLDSNVLSYSINGNNTLSLLSAGPFFRNLMTVHEKDITLLQSKLDDTDQLRSRTASINYSDYENKKGVLFSAKRKISVAEKNRLDITLDFKQHEFNQEVNFPFSVPKNYKYR